MDSTSRNAQGYSDFFTSGLRAMTGRGRRRPKAKSIDLSHSAQNRSSFWTDEYFELGHSSNPFSGRRHLSVIIGGTTVKDSAPTTPTKKRLSGLSSLSARLFSRVSPIPGKEPISSPSILPVTHDEDDALYADDEKEQSPLSIDSPSLPSLHEGSSSPPLPSLDLYPAGGSSAFDACFDLSTFKVDRRRESFLSLNSSSSDMSSLNFPPVPSWSHSFGEARSPLTPQSSSSWDHEKEEECEREVEEEEMSHTSDNGETCDWDAPAWIDWRQFHVQLL